VHRPLTGAEALLMQGCSIFNPKWATLLHGGTRQTVPEPGRECLFSGTVIMALVSSLLFGVDGAAKPDIEHDDEVDKSLETVCKDSAASVLNLFVQLRAGGRKGGLGPGMTVAGASGHPPIGSLGRGWWQCECNVDAQTHVWHVACACQPAHVYVRVVGSVCAHAP